MLERCLNLVVLPPKHIIPCQHLIGVLSIIYMALLAIVLINTTTLAQEGSTMSNPTQPPNRLVLQNVPKAGYNVHLCPFPGSLYACLEYLKKPCDYDYLMAVSGAAFRRFWNRDDGGNIDLMHLAPDSYSRTFKALGYSYHVISPNSKDKMIHAIKANISRGVPVLSFGIIGPPECGIITGYDKGGEILFGYSYFQEPSIKGYYEKSDWFETIASGSLGIIAIGHQTTKPFERETLISTIEWAIDLAKIPKRSNRPNHSSGLAAYDSWADGLEIDADYPTGDSKSLYTRLMIHGDQCVMLMERHSAAKYLRDMAKIAPEAADEMKTAADLYDAAADEVGKVWPWKSYDYNDPELLKCLPDTNTRREIAKHIRIAKDKEAEAVGHLEKALTALKAH